MTIRIHAVPVRGPLDAASEAWRKVPASVAVDYVREAQIDPAIRPLNPPGRQPPLFGRAVTVRVEPPDFGAAVKVLDLVGPGDVVVIAAEGNRDFAMVGEILCGHLRRLGVAGLVCDGAIRDVGMLASWADFSVFTRHVTPRGPMTATGGDIGLPVAIGGRVVMQGDLVIGDDDGLAALSPAAVRDRIGAAEVKIAREAEWIASLTSGRSAEETFGLAPASTV